MAVRSIQAGDFVKLRMGRAESYYLISDIKPDGIYIHSARNPANQDVLVQGPTGWNIRGALYQWQLEFVTAEVYHKRTDPIFRPTVTQPLSPVAVAQPLSPVAVAQPLSPVAVAQPLSPVAVAPEIRIVLGPKPKGITLKQWSNFNGYHQFEKVGHRLFLWDGVLRAEFKELIERKEWDAIIRILTLIKAPIRTPTTGEPNRYIRKGSPNFNHERFIKGGAPVEVMEKLVEQGEIFTNED